MRWVICALVAMGFAPAAFADDFSILRGSQTVGPALFTRWSGFYAGGQVGYSNMTADFSKATSPLVAFSLRELTLENEDKVSQWPVLGQNSTGGMGYGGFVGYNTQWQDLILGLEANYSRSSFTAVAPVSSIGRAVAAGGIPYLVDVTGSASLHLIDFGSVRARAGWVFGNILPYAFGGLALGRADYTITSLVSGQENPNSPPVFPCDLAAKPNCVDFSFSNSDAKNSAFMYGFSVGGGVDVALTPNIFVRGELEYVRFAPLADIVVSIISGRVAAGIKF
jgi:opacity protein-like surface antigen